jgi:hypothetical protein
MGVKPKRNPRCHMIAAGQAALLGIFNFLIEHWFWLFCNVDFLGVYGILRDGL